MATTNARMQQRRDTAANWLSSDPTLLAGELGIETDTGKFKIGDSVTVWSSLPYAAADPTSINNIGDVDTTNPTAVNGSALIYLDGKWIPGPALGPKNTDTDEYYNDVTFLLRANGTPGSTSFVDESQYSAPLTATSGTSMSDTQVKYGPTSAYRNTTSSARIYPTTFSASRYLLNGETSYTIEYWVYRLANTLCYPISCNDSSTVTVARGWSCTLTSSGVPTFRYGDGSSSLYFVGNNVLAVSVPQNQWTHVAICRDASTLRFFVDGVLTGSHAVSSTISSSFNAGQNMTVFTRYLSDSQTYELYLDDVRITKGVARYTSAFTPPLQAGTAPATGNGSIIYQLGYLEDVDVSTPPSNGQHLIWEGPTESWVPSDVVARQINSQAPPTTATDTGVVGEIRYDSAYLYVCTATNTWVRSPLTTW